MAEPRATSGRFLADDYPTGVNFITYGLFWDVSNDQTLPMIVSSSLTQHLRESVNGSETLADDCHPILIIVASEQHTLAIASR